MKDLVFHIGMQKTGSKALQTALKSFDNASSNICFPETGRYGGYWHKDVYLGSDPDLLQQAVDEVSEGQTGVLSYEGGYLCSDERLAQIAEMGLRKRALLFVRQPLDWLHSNRNQVIKSWDTSFEQVEQMFAHYAYCLNAFNFSTILPKWQAAVDQLIIVDYDQIESVPDWFIKKFFRQENMPELERKTANLSLNREGIKLFCRLKQLNLPLEEQREVCRILQRDFHRLLYERHNSFRFYAASEMRGVQDALQKDSTYLWRKHDVVLNFEEGDGEYWGLPNILSEKLDPDTAEAFIEAVESVNRQTKIEWAGLVARKATINPDLDKKPLGGNSVIFPEVMTTVRKNREFRKFPDAQDPRIRGGLVFPKYEPRNSTSFSADCPVFVLGCDFARDLEHALARKGGHFPLQAFSVPKAEVSGRSDRLLSDWNPGTVTQRVLTALRGTTPPQSTIIPVVGGYADLELSDVTAHPIRRYRTFERREQIAQSFTGLAKAEMVMLSLGFNEAWYDRLSERYLNSMPPVRHAELHPNRYALKWLDVFNVMPMLEEAVESLIGHGIKVVVMVSPVPPSTTFFSQDCVTANQLGKSIFRVCAERLVKKYDNVDYFPAFEIVQSAGLSAFGPDNRTVQKKTVERIAAYFLDCYGRSLAAS